MTENNKTWDPNDAGLNTDPDPGNYSTGKEDQQNADPEKRDRDEPEDSSEKKEETEESEESKNIHTPEPDKIDPVRSDPMHQFPKSK